MSSPMWTIPNTSWPVSDGVELDSEDVLAVLDAVSGVWAGAMESLADTEIPAAGGELL